MYESPQPRNRVIDDQYVITADWNVHYYDTGVTSRLDGGSATVGRRAVMDDVVIDKFYERSKNGELFNNPCTKVVTEDIISPWTGWERYAPPGTTSDRKYYGTLLAPNWCPTNFLNAIPSEDDMADLIDETISGSYAKIDSSKYQTLVALGELKETKEMLQQATDRLYKLALIIKGKLPLWWALRNTPSEADFWLEIRYGWRPFINDLQQLCETLQDAERDTYPERQTFRSKRYLYNSVQEDRIVDPNSSDRLHLRYESQVVGNVRSGVLAEVRFAGFPDTWGLWKIPQAIWDLTTLSFVVDWFFNVGDIIASWTPDTLWKPRMNWSIYDYVHTQRIVGMKHENRYTGCVVTYDMRGFSHTRITTVYNRLPGLERPWIPQWTGLDQLDWTKQIDLLALAKGFVLGVIQSMRR